MTRKRYCFHQAFLHFRTLSLVPSPLCHDFPLAHTSTLFQKGCVTRGCICFLNVDDDPAVLRTLERYVCHHFGDQFRVLHADSGAIALLHWPLRSALLTKE